MIIYIVWWFIFVIGDGDRVSYLTTFCCHIYIVAFNKEPWTEHYNCSPKCWYIILNRQVGGVNEASGIQIETRNQVVRINPCLELILNWIKHFIFNTFKEYSCNSWPFKFSRQSSECGNTAKVYFIILSL